jgi:hypothetical protein
MNGHFARSASSMPFQDEGNSESFLEQRGEPRQQPLPRQVSLIPDGLPVTSPIDKNAIDLETPGRTAIVLSRSPSSGRTSRWLKAA